MVDNLTPNQGKKALESVVKMEDAGWRRAVPGRWFGAGVAVLIASKKCAQTLDATLAVTGHQQIFLTAWTTLSLVTYFQSKAEI